MKKRLLIVDDEPGVRYGVRAFFETLGYEVDEAQGCREAESVFRARTPDLAIVDYLLPDGNALDTLRALRGLDASVPLIILTAHASIDLAVRAVKEGAEQFLTKPVELPALRVVVDRLIDDRRNRQKQAAGRSQRERAAVDPFVGDSPAIRALAAEARRLLASESPVLIQGETGVGKGVLANWLHAHGPRAEEAFVDLNCAGLTRDFLETELFGHEKGAFTGAVASKLGLFELAHRGTVFLDEIGDMDPQVQAKLLKVLEDKRFRRLGDVRDRRVDVRLVAATHQDVSAAVRDGKFRSDLYFRISTLPLRVPALRERADDIPLLATSLVRGLASDLGRPPARLSDEALTALRAYPWPGNIRELRNVLERALLLAEGDVLRRSDLRFEAPAAVGAMAMDTSLTLQQLERRYIEQVLREEGGHVERAARRLGLPRSTLYQKLKAYAANSSSV